MFQSLGAGNPIYVLHKDATPSLDKGTVVSVSIPVPKYQVPPVFGTAQEMVVDLVVKINNQDVTYQKIPANADIADFGVNGIVISDSREAMNAEVLSLKNKSIEAINSVDYYKGVVEGCDKILSDLNPEYAERQSQAQEISELKAQVRELIAQLKGSGIPAVKNEN